MDVTEDTLHFAAKEVSRNYLEDKIPLNDGIKKKAAEMGLNREQTARLIERTNTETFLGVFPTTNEFEVADPAAILKEANTKVASVDKQTAKSYIEKLERSPEEIFGLDSMEKVASIEQPDYSTKLHYNALVYADRLIEEIRVEKMAADLAYEDAESKFKELFKEAAMEGKDVESQLLLAFPEKTAMISTLVDELAEQLAKEFVMVKRASLEGFNFNRVIPDSPVIDALRTVISLA